MDAIPFLRPNLVKKESFLQYLDQIDHSKLYSNYGPLNTQFEQRVLRDYFQNLGAVTTVNNATIGLMLAIAECKRPTGHYAIMPSFTFAATPLAAMWCGLQPFFVDVCPDTWCMNETLVEEAIQSLGEQVAVVVPYATFGICMDLSYYHRLIERGIPVVVDAAASFGTFGDDGQFGIGFDGTIVFSFHATKSFGIGEGGLIYSAKTDRIQQIRQAGNFGFSDTRESMVLGLNSKLSEYGAAIALATLDVYPEKLNIRKQIYQRYQTVFEQNNLLEKGWKFQSNQGSVPHQFLSVLCPDHLTNTDVVQKLETQNIQARTYFSPACHQQPLFRAYPHTKLDVTEHISRHILSLPLWEQMGEEELQRVVKGVLHA
jgi:dTDP-4-amino-4,6-dideoxygalactose transaminase